MEGATPIRERALAPDLARGLMLLCIALANSHYFLDAPRVLGGYPQDGSWLDQAVKWTLTTFVDGRAFPLFGLLFGYGVAQLVRRNPVRTRRLLWRRAGALIAIGFTHAILLYIGDIVAAYGVLLAVGVVAIHWRDRTLLIVAGLFFLLTALPDAALDPTEGPSQAELPPDPLTAVEERLPVQLFIMLLGPIGFACPFLLGLWAGRRRALEHPSPLLIITAAIAIPAGILGAQPLALMLTQTLDTDHFAAAKALHTATGTLAGAGYAAAIALLARRLQPTNRVVKALTATGQRSLTCYLAQSVVWALAFTPFLLDLSTHLTITTTAALATATWLATVAYAARAKQRGPFESLVRRVTYRRS